MAASKGNSNLGVGTRTPPTGGGGTVTAADEGLSLSGTTVQLGDASIISALPTITVDRNIPIAAGINISLNSSNIVGPDNTNKLSSNGIRMDWNGGVNQPFIVFQDNRTVANQSNLSIRPALIDFERNNVAGTPPNIKIVDSIAGTTANLSSAQLTLDSQTTVAIIVAGTNAAGAVFASQFRNQSLSANASVVSQWFIDSSIKDFKIIKYSDANVASGNAGGTDLLHINATIGAAALRLISGSATSSIQQIIGANIYLRTANRVITIGDVSAANNNVNLAINDITQSMIFTKGVSRYLALNIGTSYSIGDIDSTGNQNVISINDAGSQISLQSFGRLVYLDPVGNKFMEFINGSTYQIGDVSGVNNNTLLIIDDSGGNTLITAQATKGFKSTTTIATGDPGSGVADWRLGKIIPAASVLNGTQYVEISIQGVVVKLATIV